METVEVPTTQLLRFNQRENLKGEIESMQAMTPQLKAPADRAEVSKRIRRLQSSLSTQSPPELSGSQRDELYKQGKELESKFTAGMLSAEEMRKNPAGAVGHHMRWEKANKADILRWKNIQQMLDPTSDDPDLSNIERVRPTGAMDRMRTDAQIPGHMTYGNIPQENWDMAFNGNGPQNTALQQAQRHAESVKPKRMITPEHREALKQRLAAAREKQKAMRQEQALQAEEASPSEEGE